MAERLKVALALFAVCVISILATELLAQSAFFVKDTFFRGTPKANSLETRVKEIGMMAGSPGYVGSAFDPEQLYREMDRRRLTYQPYSIWDSEPLQGDFFNIDAEQLHIVREQD